jgi:biotin operon repressor
MAATNAAKQRKLRQDALREMLSKKCTVEQVIRNIQKMEEQGLEIEAQELQALKYATDTRLKLINKYLPDLKSAEITGEDGKDLFPQSIQIKYV